MKNRIVFLVLTLTLFLVGTGFALAQNSSLVFNMVFGDTATLNCVGGDLVFASNGDDSGVADCLASVVFPTPTPTLTPIVQPTQKPIVNIPIVAGLSGSPDLDANNRAIVWAGEVSPDGTYFDARFILNPEGLRIRWQAFDQNVIVGDAVEFSINGRVFSSTVNSGQIFTVGTRCTGNLNCRGWDVTTAQPITYGQLGIEQTAGYTMPLAIKFTDVDSYTQSVAVWDGVAVLGDVASEGVGVANAIVREYAITDDAPIGGAGDCGQPSFPDYFPSWGDLVWSNYPYANIQAQWDAADWPCYSKYAMNISIPQFEGRNILRAAIELKQFGNAGYQYGDTGVTVVQTFLLSDTIENGATTWDNLPLALRVLSKTPVSELPQSCNFYCNPGVPYLFELNDAKNITDTFGVVLYTAAGQYHSGKYFSTVFGAEKPVLKVWYEGDAPTATETPTNVPTATPTNTPTPLPTNTPSPTPTNTPLPTATATTPATVTPTVTPSVNCTYYVGVNGNDTFPGTSTIAPFATFNKAWTKLMPGDTLCVMDGTYNQKLWPNVRDGLPGQPITVRALNDGKAVIDGGGGDVAIKLGESWPGPIGNYFVLEGLVARNAEDVILIYGHHNTLRRISAYDADADTNSSIITVAWTNNVLLEDVVAAGTGRKNILIFTANDITVRRAYVYWTRWDGAEFCNAGWPAGNGINPYSSNNVTIENSIAIGPFGARGINLTNQNESQTNSGNKVLGSIAIGTYKNPDGSWYQFPLPTNPCNYKNPPVWYEGNGAGMGQITQGAQANPVWRDVLITGFRDAGYINSKPFGTGAVNPVLDYATIYGNDLAGNGSREVVDKLGNLTITNSRIEGTTYQGAGARLTNRYENGVLTNVPLWPWPMDGRVQAEMGFTVTNQIQPYITAAP